MAYDTSPVFASLRCRRCAQTARQPRHCELLIQEKVQLTKYRIRLAILLRRVGANQGAEIEIGNLLLISICVRRVCVRFAIEQAGGVRRGGGTGNARIDKRAPALLAFCAFHPVLVERDEARVWRSRKLGKVAHDVLEYLIVVPITCLRRDKQIHPREHSTDAFH